MLSQDCLTMPDLPQLLNLLQIGWKPSHSLLLLCFCLLAHSHCPWKQPCIFYAGTGPFISLCLWFLSIVMALAVNLRCIADLCWPTASDFVTATWLNVSYNTVVIITETGTGFEPDQCHVCLIYTNSNPTTMLIQSRMKVGRSKTAAITLEGGSSQVCSCQHMQKGCVVLRLCMVYLASSSVPLCPALLFNSSHSPWHGFGLSQLNFFHWWKYCWPGTGPELHLRPYLFPVEKGKF